MFSRKKRTLLSYTVTSTILFVVLLVTVFFVFNFVATGFYDYIHRRYNSQDLLNDITKTAQEDYNKLNKKFTQFVGENRHIDILDEHGIVFYTTDNGSTQPLYTEKTLAIMSTLNTFYMENLTDSNSRQTVELLGYSTNEEHPIEYEYKGSIIFDENTLEVLYCHYPELENIKHISKEEYQFLYNCAKQEIYTETYAFTSANGNEQYIVCYRDERRTLNDLWYVDHIIFPFIFMGLLILIILVYVLRQHRFYTAKIKSLIKIMNTFEETRQITVPNSVTIVEFEQILRQFEKMAETIKQKELFKRHFMSGIAHDMKTPITEIVNVVNNILEKIIPQEKIPDELRYIKNRAFYLSDMITDLNHYSNIDSAYYKFRFKRIDINEVLRQFVTRHYVGWELRNISFDFRIEENPYFIYLDEDTFNRVLENIVENSVKYNESSFTLLISSQSDKNGITIRLGDNGKGLSNEVNPDMIFDVLVTENIGRSPGKGIGLGLAVAKKIVDAHKGTIKYVKDKTYKFMIEIWLPYIERGRK